MKYLSQGKRSLAWWLMTVAWFGKDGNKGIMRGGEVPTHQVLPAMEDLLNRRYITKSGGGRGKRDLAYTLTKDGHQYLNGHEEELKSPVDSEPIPTPPPVAYEHGAAATNVHHSVPDAPEWKGPPMPPEGRQRTAGRPPASKLSNPIISDPVPAARQTADVARTPEEAVADEFPTPEPDILRHAISESGASLNTPDKPKKPITQSSLQRLRTDAVRNALKDLLYERHADEISAKELIDYMERTND